ncbi:hypothetical protein [Bacillus ndiopicus]|uniref:hypothetical protein n=1 Tax=Bacillus ndiopicus TaxID=1347368 RepID=UPI0005A5F373|nr:hypothetical protein [Bacillus ndiopicus]
MKYLLRFISLVLWYWSFIFIIAGVAVVVSNKFNITGIPFFGFIVGLLGYSGILLWKKAGEFSNTSSKKKR